MKTRCAWCSDDPLYQAYHDHEWGVPVHDDRHLFEMLSLEGAQAGLSWITILKKRESYREAFANFTIPLVADFDEADIEHLMLNPGIVRNRLKITSVIKNARAAQLVQAEFGSLDAYLWRFVNDKPLQNAWATLSEVPAQTPESQAMSRDLKKRGFNFVGPTICYAFMQAVGMVNDHTLDCFRYAEANH
ncbi:DNA-3-methyladenine glycosylase I [Nitrincola tibetensis]|uniref:DNA-3-methyladenine glycosylase I n=1 Tax=Nitrincola tibetensis TaxID=2219697 RepID=A0A364NMY9_9GAMM|nr:DNA-3-methyladenine glycosylase I [Nitrincola tibetensis]RAU18265.1 DNA-3-methyladenine glycosylase I [Nitrincola tibetensis]